MHAMASTDQTKNAIRVTLQKDTIASLEFVTDTAECHGCLACSSSQRVRSKFYGVSITVDDLVYPLMTLVLHL